MSDVNFSAKNRVVPDYAMNYPKANGGSVFEQNNIRFRIEGNYLTDFTDKGIKSFIEEHYNKETGFLGGWLGWGGKDLEFDDVKAFIQAVAANADKVPGATFDLTDPELGLFDDDKINAKEIRSSFSINFKEGPGKSATEVAFVDAGSVTYHLKDAKKAEEKAKAELDRLKPAHEKLENALASARENRNDIAERIGNNALGRLSQIDERISEINETFADLAAEKGQYEDRIRALQKGTGLTESDKALDENGRLKMINELRRAIRGIGAEKEELKTELNKLHKQLGEKHGFWSFLGGGSTLNDLREANKEVEAASKKVKASSQKMSGVYEEASRTKNYREALEKGEDPTEWAPKEAEAPKDAASKPSMPTQDEFAKLPTPMAKASALAALPPQNQLAYLDTIKDAERRDLMKALQARWQASASTNPLGMAENDFKALAAQRPGIQNAMALMAMKYPETQDDLLSELNLEHKQALLAQFNEQVLTKDTGLLASLKLEQAAHDKLDAQAKAFMAKLEQQIVAGSKPSEQPVKTADTPVVQPEQTKVEVPAKLEQPVKPVETNTQPVETKQQPVKPAETNTQPVVTPKQEQPVKPVETKQEQPVKPVKTTQPKVTPTKPKNTAPKDPVQKPAQQKPVQTGKTSAPLKEEPVPNHADAVKEFSAMPANTEQEAVNKIVKFKGYNVQQQKSILDHFAEPMAKAELLAALSDMPARRQELIGLLAAPERQAVADVLKSNKGNYGDPGVEQFIEGLVKELEAKVPAKSEPANKTEAPVKTEPAKTPDAGKTVDLASLQPSGGTAQPTVNPTQPTQPPPVAVNMAPKLAELEKTLKNKAWSSYVGGGYAGYETINQPEVRDTLMAEIWMNGSAADRNKMAKMLVDNGQSKALGSLLGTQGITDADVAAVVTASGFPTKTFMSAVTDNQAFQVLNSVAKVAAGGNQASSVKFLKDTVGIYTGTVKDRETPFLQMKTQAEQEARWNKLPQDLRDSITKLLR